VQKGIQGKTTVLKEQWMFSLFAAMSVSICWNPKAVCSKNDVNIKTAQLYKFSNAWRILKNPMEFQLFYLYQTGRLSCKYNDYAMEFLGNMKNVDKDAYCYKRKRLCIFVG